MPPCRPRSNRRAAGSLPLARVESYFPIQPFNQPQVTRIVPLSGPFSAPPDDPCKIFGGR